MNISFYRMNVLRLSGINSILGIDFTDYGLNVVELKSYRGILNKYHSKYKVANSFTISFEKDESPDEKGKKLAQERKDRKIKTRFCVSSIHSATARTVTAEIPPDVEDVEAWIRENYEKFIRVPVPSRELAFAYEIIPSSEPPHRCRISFIREAERQEYISLFTSGGLHLLSLGLDDDKSTDTERTPDPVLTALCPEGFVGSRSVELAIKGFLPELNSLNFLTETEKKKTTEEKDKSLFNRAVLALGAALFVLLALQFGLNKYLQNKSDGIDEQLLQVGPVYSEVEALGRQVSALKSELNGDGGTNRRSNVAKALHDIAESTRDGVWLYKLDMNHEDIDISGYARTNELAASYLGALQADKRFSDVQVIRIGAPTESEAASFSNSGIKSAVTFAIKMRDGK